MSFLSLILMYVSLGFQIYARLQHIFWIEASFKMLCTFLFLAVAYFSQKECPKSNPTTYFKRMFLGLMFCSLGDILLIFIRFNSIFFILGTASFAVAHIFFSSAFFCFGKLRIRDLVLTVFFSIPCICMVLNRQWINPQNMTPVLIGYAVIISFMLSKSLTLWQYRKSNRYFVNVTIFSATLFVISDCVLLFAIFSTHKPNNLTPVNNILYYTAQGLFGLSFRKELLLPQRNSKLNA